MAGCFTELDLSPNPIEMARRRVATERGYIDLTSSNPTHQGFLFPADVLQKAAATYWQQRRYDPQPRGLPAAREAIASDYARRSSSIAQQTTTAPNPPTADAILLTTSTSEAYSLLFALLADAGDNVLAPDVTYPLFDFLAEIHHVELRSYHMEEQRGWQIDPQSLLAQADERTRAVLLISPHNPTGAVLSRPLAALDQLALPLICDEVFAAFPYGVSAVPFAAQLHPDVPVFHLNGISKRFALPDMKLGWIALNEPALAAYGERLELLNDTFLGASSLIQTMLPTLFAAGEPFVADMANHVQRNLTYALERFAQSATLSAHQPDGGYYLFPAVAGWEDEEQLVLFLLEHGVLVHPGFFYGDVPGVHVMISALTERERFVQGIERICTLLG